MAKAGELFTVFLEFEASFPDEARILCEDPSITPAMREGREPLHPDTVQFIDDFFVEEKQLAKEDD